MTERPPFDPIRAGFYLVGAILLSFVMVVFTYMGFCMWAAAAVIEGRWRCDADSRIIDLLSQALSAALAFAGGYKLGSNNEKK